MTVLTSGNVDHVRDGFDIAIVTDMTALAEATLMMTKLGAPIMGFMRRPNISSATAFRRVMSTCGGSNCWPGERSTPARSTVHRDDTRVTVDFRPRLICNDLMLLRQSVLSGLEFATLPAFICKHDLAAGQWSRSCGMAAA